ncbi:hypothetical protein [Stappia sp. ES.058]|uniref:hypothetical protein n=1 Tax=Stappia sp. ES.058 TaxID=1881061 RepID=UPI00087D15F2|nr:hypothetical protein [Stappia sp. ES.058]SDU04795.1 hypothetical protein SAMN05428979_1324 [Stappia sp. ES.058]
MFDIFANSIMTATRARTDEQLPDRYVDPIGLTTGPARNTDNRRPPLTQGRR